MSYVTLPTVSASASGSDEVFSLRELIFAYLDGGRQELVLTIQNTGTANAYLTANASESSSADEATNDGVPRVFGPYAVPGGVPFLYLVDGASLEITPKMVGV